jgi:hypothetical protein
MLLRYLFLSDFYYYDKRISLKVQYFFKTGILHRRQVIIGEIQSGSSPIYDPC